MYFRIPHSQFVHIFGEENPDDIVLSDPEEDISYITSILPHTQFVHFFGDENPEDIVLSDPDEDDSPPSDTPLNIARGSNHAKSVNNF